MPPYRLLTLSYELPPVPTGGPLPPTQPFCQRRSRMLKRKAGPVDDVTSSEFDPAVPASG
jgi:hypothetical protein